uniref:Uncharacterized protein n=1 Tax=Anguilla anguilla TaxID=7936 RepID=A0A0E9VKJ0_ANGAN
MVPWVSNAAVQIRSISKGEIGLLAYFLV